MNLAAIDPNLVITLGSILLTGVGWIYHRARGDKTDSLSTMISGLVDSAIHIAEVEADSHPDEVRAKVTAYVWITLLKLKVPRNASTELLVNAAIESAISAAIQAAKDNDALLEKAQATMAEVQARMANPPPLPKPTITYTEIKDQAAYDAAVKANHEAQAASEAAAKLGPAK